MSRWMDLLLAALALLCLWRCRIVRPLSAFYTDALSPKACLPVRGLMAVLVLLHHVAQQTGAGRFFRMFLYVGVLPVSVFFFLSGYGLMLGCMSGRYDRRRFLMRRVPPLLVPALLSLCLFSLCTLAAGEATAPLTLIRLIFAADPILVIHWYVLVILLFYLAFGLFLWLFGDRPKRLLAAMALFCLVYQVLLGLQAAGQWWMNTCQLLVFGMAWALYRDRLIPGVRRAWWPLFLGCALAFLLLWQYFDAVFALRPGYWFRLLLLILRCCLFTACCLLLFWKLRLDNPALRFLGKCSYELYIFQIIPLYLFRSGAIWIGDDLVYALAVCMGTVLLAALLHPVTAALKRRCAAAAKK